MPRSIRLLGGLPTAALCGLALLAATHLPALSVAPPTFSELVAAADSVVQGHVQSITVRRVKAADGEDMIRTIITVRVDDLLKGTAGETVEINQLGGQIGSERLDVPGMPQYAKSEEVFVFLHDQRTALSNVVRVVHGLFPVRDDPATGHRYVSRTDGMPLSAVAEIATASIDAARVDPLIIAQKRATAMVPQDFATVVRAEVSRQRLEARKTE